MNSSHHYILLLPILLPLAIAALSLIPILTKPMGYLAPLSVLPIFYITWEFFAQSSESIISLQLPFLFLGTELGLDRLGASFILLSSIVAFFATSFSRSHISDPKESRYFRFFFFSALSGAFGSALSLDIVSFYTFFALMNFAGFGLVVQPRNEGARSAGQFYIVLSLIGEMCLLAALFLASFESDSLLISQIIQKLPYAANKNWIIGLFFAGFGVKVGVIPLHFWLPRSYYYALLPSVALFSGALSKIGVLGWLRFSSLGEIPLSDVWPYIFIASGILMALYGAFVGLLQTRARTALAFSSLSQMGYLCIATGAALSSHHLVEPALAACVAYAFHHGLLKTFLFIGTALLPQQPKSSWQRVLLLGMLGFASLALVGLPLSSGIYVKTLLKEATHFEGILYTLLQVFYVLGASGSALLMTRYFTLALRTPAESSTASFSGWTSTFCSWILCVGGIFFLPQLMTFMGFNIPPVDLSLFKSLTSFAPVLVSSAILLALTRKVWLRTSLHSPRPLDPVLYEGYHIFFETWPNRLAHAFNTFVSRSQSFIKKLRIEERTSRTIQKAASLKTSWFMGTSFLLIIWAIMWLFMHNGGVR